MVSRRYISLAGIYECATDPFRDPEKSKYGKSPRLKRHKHAIALCDIQLTAANAVAFVAIIKLGMAVRAGRATRFDFLLSEFESCMA